MSLSAVILPEDQSLLLSVPWLVVGGGVTQRRSLSSLLLAEVLSSNTVHIHDALLGERLAHGHGLAFFLGSVLDLSDDAGTLELLKAVADVLTGGHACLLLLGATVGLGSEVLAETLHTSLLAHVELVANGGSTDEKPVVVIWCQFLVAGSLNSLGPLYNIILIRTRIGKYSITHAHLGRLTRSFLCCCFNSTYIRDLELVKLLQMLSEYLDKLGRWDVFHSVYVSVEEGKVLLHAKTIDT